MKPKHAMVAVVVVWGLAMLFETGQGFDAWVGLCAERSESVGLVTLVVVAVVGVGWFLTSLFFGAIMVGLHFWKRAEDRKATAQLVSGTPLSART